MVRVRVRVRVRVTTFRVAGLQPNRARHPTRRVRRFVSEREPWIQ